MIMRFVVVAGIIFFAGSDLLAQGAEDPKAFQESVEKRLSALEQQKAQAKGDTKAPWSDFLRFYGDLRLRHQMIDTELADQRHLGRMRVRLGLEAKVNDDVDFHLRMVTAQGGDPTSTNQTFDGGFTKKPFNLDMAYVDWRSCESSHIYAGKMKNPFFQPGVSQLIWDNDLTPEGVAASWKGSLGDGASLFATGAGFWVDERSAAADTFLWGAQLGCEVRMCEDSTLKAGVSLFDYANVKGYAPFFSSGSTAGLGNTLSGGSYAKEFRELEFFLEYACRLGGIPVTLMGDFVNNVATSSADHGWLAGVQAGKLKERGDWTARWMYKVLEADAVIGDFADSDAWGGGTNGRGHEFGLEMQVAKKVTGGLTYYKTQNTLGATTDYHRVNLDFIFKF